METAMATNATAVSMGEYLRTSYEWEPEWVDGELVERSLPNIEHSLSQQRISLALGNSLNRSRLFCLPQLRVKVSPARWRIPGFCRPGAQRRLSLEPLLGNRDRLAGGFTA